MNDISKLKSSELLALHADLSDELRQRKLVRTSNNPVGDYAEFLFCKAFEWEQAPNSQRSYDATDANGIRYQIKSRRLTQHNTSRQLSALRDLPGAHFDFLAGVLFARDYSILRAALIPHQLIIERSKFVERTNSHKFHLREDIWDAPNVEDITEKLRSIVI